jgi:hypothetical protein
VVPMVFDAKSSQTTRALPLSDLIRLSIVRTQHVSDRYTFRCMRFGARERSIRSPTA